jgi:2-desacetyl-2-hydroxyethyl bacteriochlorophyllide A dehydrogenase
MKSLVYEGNHTLAWKETDIPSIAPGEVLIRTAYTGICGTDLLIWHDKHIRVRPPVILGHEFSGYIERAGSPDSPFKPGDRVIVEPLLSCGRCKGCLQGDYNLCTAIKLIGIDVDGSMTQFVKSPENKLIRIPDRVSMQDAAFVEPLAVAVHMIRQAGGVKGNETVLVAGAGPIGLIAAALARMHGAKVLISEIMPYRIGKAKELGFEVIDAQQPVGDCVRNVTDGRGADVAFEATGVPAAFAGCVDAVGVKGRVVIVGLPKSLHSLDTNQVVAKELSITGSRVYTRADFEEALRLIEDGRIRPRDFISKTIPLDEAIESGFEAIERGEPAIKIMLDHGCGDEAR